MVFLSVMSAPVVDLLSLQKLSQGCIPIQTLIFVVSSQTPVTPTHQSNSRITR